MLLLECWNFRYKAESQLQSLTILWQRVQMFSQLLSFWFGKYSHVNNIVTFISGASCRTETRREKKITPTKQVFLSMIKQALAETKLAHEISTNTKRERQKRGTEILLCSSCRCVCVGMPFFFHWFCFEWVLHCFLVTFFILFFSWTNSAEDP